MFAEGVVSRAGEQRWAWHGADVFQHAGPRWLWRGTLAAPVSRAAVGRSGQLLARLRTGALVYCDSDGCHQEARAELPYLFAFLTGEDPPPLPPDTRYACAAASGSLRIESATYHCFGYSLELLTLEQAPR